MNWLTKLSKFSSFATRKHASTTSGEPPCSLDNLPVEILRMIARCLHSKELCVLSLVCKTFYDICKPFKPFDLSDHPGTRRDFLLLLEQDLPDYLLCYTCVWLYKWKDPQSKDPRLCPRRKIRPHLSYRHLDIQHHDRSVEREIIDLAHRHSWHGSEYGLPTSYILRKLQGEEKFDKSLKMPAVSMMGCYWGVDSLVVNTEFELRINRKDNSHPFHAFVLSDPPEEWTEAPNRPPIVHSASSAITRWLGFNVHEFRSRQSTFGNDGNKARFYLCWDCQTSVQLSCHKDKGDWETVTIKTSQSLGSRREPLGFDVMIAGLRKSDRHHMPDKMLHGLACGDSMNYQTETTQPPYCIVTPSDDLIDDGKITLENNLGVIAWFQRHRSLYRQRIWCEAGADQWVYDQLYPSLLTDEDGNGRLAFLSEEVWEGIPDYAPRRIVPLRKYWLRHLVWDMPTGAVRKVGRKLPGLSAQRGKQKT